MKHTPTPYRLGRPIDAVVADTPKDSADSRADEGHQKHYGGYVICESCTMSDAAFIVEACNAYEKHVQQIQHLDSAVKAQASAITRLERERGALFEALREAKRGTLIEGPLSVANLGGALDTTRAILYKAIALCEGGAE